MSDVKMLHYFKDVLHTIKNSLESLDSNCYLKLIDDCEKTIKSGHKIIASGLGKNVPICEKFVGTLNSLGIDARFLHTNTALHGDLGIIKNGDLVILLSKGGNTIETVSLAKNLDNKHVKKWLITFELNGKCVEFVDDCIILNLENEGDLWNIVPNNSTTVYLIVMQGVAMALAKDLGVSIDEFRINHPGGGIGAKLSGKNLWG